MEVEGHKVSFSITPCFLRQSLSLNLEHNGLLKLTESQALQCLHSAGITGLHCHAWLAM